MVIRRLFVGTTADAFAHVHRRRLYSDRLSTRPFKPGRLNQHVSLYQRYACLHLLFLATLPDA